MPAIIVLLMNAFFGQQLADRLTTAQWTSAARDMVSAYSVQLEEDASYQALLAAAAQQRSVADQLRSDINTLRRARGEARDPARLDTLRQDRLDRVNLLTATETSLENRRQQIASELLATADAETSDTARQSQAGFILATASASEAELFATDMRRIADEDFTKPRYTRVLHSAGAAARTDGKRDDAHPLRDCARPGPGWFPRWPVRMWAPNSAPGTMWNT